MELRELLAVILPWEPDYQCKAKSTPEAEDVGVLVETLIRNLFIWRKMFQEIIFNLKCKPTCAALYLTSAFSELWIKTDIARDMILNKSKYEYFIFPLLCECSSIVAISHQQ